MNVLSHNKRFALVVMAAFGTLIFPAWALDPPSNYTNIGSVINTRHNLSMLGLVGISAVLHNGARNQYEEVCVYCHTPHGANSTVAAPLWNRTVKATTYTVYNSASLTQTVSQPGNSSLTCLSCHDGQTAIDSVINMPGSGRYDVGQATTQSTVFLNSWNNTGGALDTTIHRGINSTNGTLGNGTGSDNLGCMTCHSPEGNACTFGSVCANDMRVMNLGTDLTNDHPVGVTFPAATGPGTDWNTPGGVKDTSLYFDVNTNTKMDKDEIRTYSGQVECASCHDPHGVPDPANGNIFKPTFLRVANTGSALCLTCHNK